MEVQPMSRQLTDDIEDFRAKIGKIVDTLESISTSSKSIPGTVQKDLSGKFKKLDDGLDNVSTQLKNTLNLLDDIRRRWG